MSANSLTVYLMGNRYQLLEKLGQGGMGAVYKARDRLSGDTVALKQVIAPAAGLQFASLSHESDGALALALEFRTLAGLRHPHIVSVLDYGFDTPAVNAPRLPFFTMQYIENARTLTECAGELDVPGKIGLLVMMLQALTYLHRRNIIHRDLKPANVLVTAEGVVKVMDFGLALTPTESGLAQGAVGTLTYMAPELFMEHPASVQSDLYAVGVIAYEIFTGRYPFGSSNVGLLIHSILTTSPDMSLLPDDLALVMQRLLAKEPEARYERADAVIMALCEATGTPLPTEDPLLRESFLQAAAFVGREAEFDILHAALQDVVSETPRGAAWLVGGESGVGKSRLMDELQTRALVGNCLVLRGQGVEGGGLPYQVWRVPLRRLAVSMALSDVEASILKEVIPDIDFLLEREIATVPELAGIAGQQRLLLTILDLFKRQQTPVVLILEDLHWAIESLEPVKALLQLVGELRVLIIGTYRDDERPDLPEMFPAMQMMKLHRLDSTAIGELSVSMLGDAGRQPHILNLLQRETEGNVFFLVEVVRALAEQAGRLGDVGTMTLPHQVFAGGVREAVRRRLARVPAGLHNLLKLAAVAGRQLDLAVLSALGETDLDDHLALCASAAVLEVADGQWRFAHDKIRDGLLLDLNDAERPALHRRVAEAIEAVYPGDHAWAEVLVEHWQHAADAAREVYYIQIACERLVHYVARYHRALDLLERAIMLTDQVPEVVAQRVMLFKLLGDGHDKLGQFPSAQAYYEQSLALAEQVGDQYGRAEALRSAGQVAMRQGMHGPATELLEQALALYREQGERYGIAACLSNLGSLARLRGDYAAAHDLQQQSLVLRRDINDMLGIGASLNNLGNLAYLQGDYAAARDYHEQSLAIKRQINDRAGTALSLNNLSAICFDQQDYAAAQDYLVQSLAIRYEINDPLGISSSLSMLGNVAAAQGEYMAACDYYDQSLALKREINDRPGLAEVLVNRAGALIQLGDRTGARYDLHEGLEIAHSVSHTAPMLEGLLMLARLSLLDGDIVTAAEWATLLEGHPALWNEIKENQLNPLLAEVEAALSAADFQAARDRGRALDLDSVVRQVIHESAAGPLPG